jgi:hypothetical protein
VLHDKIVSNIQEVRARGARTIVIAEEGDEAVVPYADTSSASRCPTLLQPLLATVPLQVFACEMATARATTSTSRATSPSRHRRVLVGAHAHHHEQYDMSRVSCQPDPSVLRSRPCRTPTGRKPHAV